MGIGPGELLSIGCALAWAVGVIIYKRLGEDLPPLKLCLLKNLIVLVLVAGTVVLLLSPLGASLGLPALSRPALDTPTVLAALASGLIGIAMADTLYLRALNRIGAGRMGVIGNLYSPFVIVLSFAFLGERLSPLQGLGFLLVMAGLLVVNAPARLDQVGRASLRRGLIEGALAMALMAVAIVMMKRPLESHPFWWLVLLRVTGAVAGLGLLVAAMPSLRRDWRVAGRPRRWGSLLAAAFIGQYLSMSMWLAGFKYTDASVASILNETSSIFILVLAAVFLREPLRRRSLLGVGLTFGGVACMLVPGHTGP